MPDEPGSRVRCCGGFPHRILGLVHVEENGGLELRQGSAGADDHASAAADGLSGASIKGTASNSPRAYQKPKSYPPSDSATSRAAFHLSSG